MNIEETKKAIAVMQAFVDGKKIERQGGYAIKDPEWNWTDNDYTIVPERIVGWAVVGEDGVFESIFNVKSSATHQANTASDLCVVRLVEERE